MRYLGVFAFFLAIGLAVMGGDYYEQRKVAQGDLTVSAYIEGLSERAAGVADGSAFGSTPRITAQSALPKAPEGWQRRFWVAEDEERLTGEDHTSDAYFQQMGMGDETLMKLARNQAALGVKNKRKTTYVYENASDMVVMSARKSERSRMNARSAAAMNMVAANISAMSSFEGFAVIQGVVWQRSLGMFGGMDVGGDDKPNVRSFTAKLGAIRLRVRTTADDQTVREFMGMIDYDALNALLDEPLEGVGSSAPVLSIEDQIEAAEFVVAIEEDERSARAANAEERMMKAFQPNGVEKLLLGSTDDQGLKAQDKTDTQKARNKQVALQMKQMKPVLLKLGAMGLDAMDLITLYDSGSAMAELDYARFNAGQLTDKHPGYPTLQETARRQEPVGSCMEVFAEGVFCGQDAKTLREIINSGMFHDNVHMGLRDSLDKTIKRPVRRAFPDFSEGLSDKRLKRIHSDLDWWKLTPGDLIITYDSAASQSTADAAEYEAGKLRETHPGYAVQVHEYGNWLAPGTCLQLRNGKMFCGKEADTIREAVHFGGVSGIKISAPAAPSQQEIATSIAALTRLGLTPNDMVVTYDALDRKNRNDRLLFAKGNLPQSHPGFATRKMEHDRGLAPGSCLQLANGKVHCNKNAEAIRDALRLRDRATKAQAGVQQEATERTEVKINRLVTTGRLKRKSSGCGAGKFCRVGE